MLRTHSDVIVSGGFYALDMSANLRRRKRLRTLVCPQCGALGLKRIIYGMPDEDFPFEKYIVGGCIMSEADIGCTKCDWVGIWAEL